jgi:hypothetical protein
MFRINYNAGREAGKTVWVRNKEIKTRYHSRFSSRFPKIKRNRRKAVSFNKRITSWKMFVKTLKLIWRYGLVISWLIAMVACGLRLGFKTPPESPTMPAEASLAPFPSKFTSADISAIEKDLFVKYFGDKADEAKKIAYCESGNDPQAHNYNPKTRDDSYGLFQINLWGNNKLTRPAPEILLTEEGNIKFAKQLYDSAGGWSRDWIKCSRNL